MGPKKVRHPGKVGRKTPSPPRNRSSTGLGDSKSRVTADSKLHYNGQGNEAFFDRFKEVLYHDLVNEQDYMEQVACLVRDGDFKQLADVDTSSYDAASDPGGFKMEILKVRIKDREQDKLRIVKQQKKLFTYLESKLSQEFIAQLGNENKAEFEAITRSRDSKKLWNLITRLATVGAAVDLSHAKNQAVNKLHNTVQTAGMSLTDYHKLFKARAGVCVTLGALKQDQIDGEDYGDRFISQLDPARFGDMQVKYRNDLRSKIIKPVENYEAAYSLAANTVSIRKSGAGFAFYTAGAISKTSANPRQKEGKQYAKSNEKGTKGVKIKNTPENSACNNCGKLGHWKRDCPDIKAGDSDNIDKAIRERSAAGGGHAPTRSGVANLVIGQIPHDTLCDDDFGCVFVAVDPGKGHGLPKDAVVLDSGANRSIWHNRKIMGTLRDASTRLVLSTAMTGTNIVSNKEGNTAFGTAHYSPQVAVNIQAFCEVSQYAHYYRDDDMFEVVMPGDRTYKFHKDRSTELYVCFLNGPPRGEEDDFDSLPPLVDNSDVEDDDDDHTDRDLSAA